MTEKLDVLVVGAGISGIGAGYHLQNKCPDAKFVILEGRDKIGGTWAVSYTHLTLPTNREV